jgi:cytochrome b561
VLVAKASHVLLYASMAAMPLIGWAMLAAGGYPVDLTSGLILPPIVPHDLWLYAWLRQAHTVVAVLFFALILGHLCASLFHGLVRKDGVLRSMTVGTKPLPPEPPQGHGETPEGELYPPVQTPDGPAPEPKVD